MIEYLGWLSTLCFALAGLPQVLHAVRRGNLADFSLGFLLLWFAGNSFGLIYSLGIESKPLFVGFLTSVGFGLILWKYKLFPRKGPS